MRFNEFFARTTGLAAPFPYQARLAEEPWPDLLEIPTGLGKRLRWCSHGYGSAAISPVARANGPSPGRQGDSSIVYLYWLRAGMSGRGLVAVIDLERLMYFSEFFAQATGGNEGNGFDPMGWQCRLACGDAADPQLPKTLSTGVECKSRMIDVPTGCGKTEGLLLAWMWNRIVLNDTKWPRRLVYCVPMRTLVEQTRERVLVWSKNLLAYAEEPDLTPAVREDLRWLAARSPVIVMGGEESESAIREWDIHPEKPAILIGTQDMLLSRALNRGYALRRPRWPIHFGLLNNDCLWICDEVQLMGPGVATACQLEAFRGATGGAIGPRGLTSFFGSRSATWYASATSSLGILNTREWRDVERPSDFVFSLSEGEKTETASVIGRRRFARKRLKAHRDWHFGENAPPLERVADIIEHHGEMVVGLNKHNAPDAVPRRSLVICNTVGRAIAVFDALLQKQAAGVIQGVDLVLLHSRFRPADRYARACRLNQSTLASYPNGQIVVATQVVEAGVDLSSGVLWTEVAPLSSLVQRLGRLNRTGEFGSNGRADFGWTPLAIVVGLALPTIPATPKEKKEEKEKEVRLHYLPYDQTRSEAAWSALGNLEGDAAPAAFESIRDAIASSIQSCPYSLQRHELLDFFDTDSNLSLGYTDVSPFVRGMDEDTDVYVLWREWAGDPNELFRGDIGRDELCAVPISRLTGKDSFGGWRQDGWVWLRQGQGGGWVSAGTQGIFPGATLLLRASAGGYDSELGWTGNKEHKPVDLYQPAEDPSDEDALSWLNQGWRSIALHVQDVRDVLRDIFAVLAEDDSLTADEKATCLKAALWHDIGKNHEDWKSAAIEALTKAGIQPPLDQLPLAKFSLSESPQLKDEEGHALAGGTLRRKIYELKKSFRPGMAHEVASALALRQRHIQTAGQLRSPKTMDAYIAQLLAEYLVMSHHGQVRKVLRDEISRNPKGAKTTDTVRGVSEGDPLPTVMVEGEKLGCDALSVDCRRIGRDAHGYESYTRGVLRLLDHYGPFRLAYLEALLRAADARASMDVAQ